MMLENCKLRASPAKCFNILIKMSKVQKGVGQQEVIRKPNKIAQNKVNYLAYHRYFKGKLNVLRNMILIHRMY
jgi:hypothetical protein